MQEENFTSADPSTYDIDGDFIRSYSTPGKENEVTPDSIGEALLIAICSPNFPYTKDEKYYFSAGTDIFTFARHYFIYMESKANDPAPK